MCSNRPFSAGDSKTCLVWPSYHLPTLPSPCNNPYTPATSTANRNLRHPLRHLPGTALELGNFGTAEFNQAPPLSLPYHNYYYHHHQISSTIPFNSYFPFTQPNTSHYLVASSFLFPLLRQHRRLRFVVFRQSLFLSPSVGNIPIYWASSDL